MLRQFAFSLVNIFKSPIRPYDCLLSAPLSTCHMMPLLPQSVYFFSAIKQGRLGIAKQLLAHGANVNGENDPLASQLRIAV